ncbi:MAG: hypothetical protein AB8G26_02920, partial [Ilumatobacter sp.]
MRSAIARATAVAASFATLATACGAETDSVDAEARPTAADAVGQALPLVRTPVIGIDAELDLSETDA